MLKEETKQNKKFSQTIPFRDDSDLHSINIPESMQAKYSNHGNTHIKESSHFSHLTCSRWGGPACSWGHIKTRAPAWFTAGTRKKNISQLAFNCRPHSKESTAKVKGATLLSCLGCSFCTDWNSIQQRGILWESQATTNWSECWYQCRHINCLFTISCYLEVKKPVLLALSRRVRLEYIYFCLILLLSIRQKSALSPLSR